jgi:hypothetical protein
MWMRQPVTRCVAFDQICLCVEVMPVAFMSYIAADGWKN